MDVVEGEPAATAGLRRWDVITTVSGAARSRTATPSCGRSPALRPGTEVKLGVVRDGRPMTVSARLGERSPDDEDAPAEARRPRRRRRRRATPSASSVAALPAATRAELRVPRERVGVVIQDVLGADPGTDLLEEGDLVVEVNRRATPDLAAYRRVVGALAPGEPAWLYVFRPRQRAAFLTRDRGGEAPVKPRVLIVDDEDAVRSSLKMIFEYEGYEVLLAANGPVGLKLAEQESPDLVFLDIKMPQMDGLEVLKQLKERDGSAAGRHPLRPRHGQDGGRGGEARRLRLHREAARTASAS